MATINNLPPFINLFDFHSIQIKAQAVFSCHGSGWSLIVHQVILHRGIRTTHKALFVQAIMLNDFKCLSCLIFLILEVQKPHRSNYYLPSVIYLLHFRICRIKGDSVFWYFNQYFPCRHSDRWFPKTYGLKICQRSFRTPYKTDTIKLILFDHPKGCPCFILIVFKVHDPVATINNLPPFINLFDFHSIQIKAQAVFSCHGSGWSLIVHQVILHRGIRTTHKALFVQAIMLNDFKCLSCLIFLILEVQKPHRSNYYLPSVIYLLHFRICRIKGDSVFWYFNYYLIYCLHNLRSSHAKDKQ